MGSWLGAIKVIFRTCTNRALGRLGLGTDLNSASVIRLGSGSRNSASVIWGDADAIGVPRVFVDVKSWKRVTKVVNSACDQK